MARDKSQRTTQNFPPLQISEIAGVNIWTNNLTVMKEFYKDILELPLHSDHGDFIAFNLGSARLNIGLHDKVADDNNDPFRIMINLGVTDIFFETDRLRKNNVKFIRQPERESWGGWIATFCDPDGNILQLLQKN